MIKTTVCNLLNDGERITTYCGDEDYTDHLGAIDGVGGRALHEVLLELQMESVAERVYDLWWTSVPRVIWGKHPGDPHSDLHSESQ